METGKVYFEGEYIPYTCARYENYSLMLSICVGSILCLKAVFFFKLVELFA